MSRDAPFKIELRGLKSLQEKLKGAERGHGAYAKMREIAEDFVDLTQNDPGAGVHYSYGPVGNAPISDWIEDKPGPYPTGYLSENHEVGGRKGLSVQVVSRAPYTAKIIDGGSTNLPHGEGYIAPNNYPERTLKKVVDSTGYEQDIREILLRYYNLHDYL